MLSKSENLEPRTLTLRINNDIVLKGLNFIKNEWAIKTDSKAIDYALLTYEKNHIEYFELLEKNRVLEERIEAFKEYFQLIEDSNKVLKSLSKDFLK